MLLCNNPKAFVLKRAKELQVPAVVFSRQELDDAAGALAGEATHMPAPEASRQERSVLGLLKAHRIDFIVLAGFLWKIPAHVISAWPGRIVNIHPALLPKYGGAGMYGERVHREVIKNKEKESGITIHVVDQLYDHGPILFQATCPVDGTDTPEALARKIYALEQQYFPVVVDKYIKQVAV